MNKISFFTLSSLLAVGTVSCSVRTHEPISDLARSGDAILLPLEKPTLCQVNEQWYIKGYHAEVERRNRPCIQTEKKPNELKRQERYYLVDDEEDFEPRYAPMPEEMAKNILKGKYSHSDAISFINQKWVKYLPEGEVKEVGTKASAPAFFRNMSSHRLLQDEEQNKSYMLARVGEMTANFSSLLIYPLAGISAIVIDLPGSIILGPPSAEVQKAQPEELQ